MRPQEGWYVRGTMTSSASGVSREYFIIDNKMSSQPWYITMNTAQVVLSDPIFMTPDWSQKGLDVNWNVLGIADTYYRGYSDVDWCVDDDWLCVLDWEIDSKYGSSDSMAVVIFDKSKVPLLTYDSSYDAYSISGPVDAIIGRSYTSAQEFFSPFNYANFSAGDSGYFEVRLGGFVSGSTVAPSPFYEGYAMLFNPFFAGTNENINFYSVDGTSINDLCVYPFLRGFTPKVGIQRRLKIRLSVAWAVPVDKCPAGTQVGDSWPKVRPLEVQMEDAYSAWMDSALANTPVSDSSQVGQQIKDYNDQLDASDNWGELATAGWAFIQPMFDSFDFIFVILGIAAVSFILLLLIKKGMG